jgi:hypothetical protein
LRCLRTELGKLPEPQGLRELLPSEGVGVPLEALRGMDETGLRGLMADVAAALQATGAQLSDVVGQRYFVHAVTHSVMPRV